MISNVNRLSLAVGMVIATLVGQAAAAPAPSENATINLIRLLVEQGILKQDKADALIAQAQNEAAQAKQAAASTAVAAGPVAAPGDVRVQYVPAAVRDQIRDQVKAEVMATAKQENWAAPNTFRTGLRASASMATSACAMNRVTTRAATATKSSTSPNSTTTARTT